LIIASPVTEAVGCCTCFGSSAKRRKLVHFRWFSVFLLYYSSNVSNVWFFLLSLSHFCLNHRICIACLSLLRVRLY
jgi:hypothetical protein